MNTGDYLGRYRIVRKIGEGGMGEVFLAEDQKLNRQIAVKVLSADFASDSSRMMRFVHEAVSASALNHPNIITIYEINDENDPPFIAMEFVVGDTLGRRMKQSPLEVHETLDVSIQIATALAAAHDAGVVHRDVKPDNVILRPDGLVKVLDFGLAKQVDRVSADYEADTFPDVKTHPGLVMGTVAYMSPEQARGKLVDARSDIFSFGAVIYQMVSGRLPFIGENDVDVVGSILHKEPRPLSKSARNIPHDVELIIKKALRKDREERYQSMRELVADLKEVREDLRLNSKNGHKRNTDGNGRPAGEFNEDERGLPTEQFHAAPVHSTQDVTVAASTLSGILMSEIKAHPVRSLGASLLIAAILAGLAYVTLWGVGIWRQPEKFQTMRLSKLTFSGNVKSFIAAISPDGKYFAYVVQEAGEEGLIIRQTATESSITIVRPGTNNITGAAFSPDSNFVYYSMAEGQGQSALYQAPAFGGPSRKLIANAEKRVTFSPDGKTLAFIRNSTAILLADMPDGNNVRPLANAAAGNRWINLAWSPAGDSIATVYYSQSDSNDHLSLVSVTDGSEKPIESNPWLRLRGVDWLPEAKGLVVSGRDFDSQAAQLWLIDNPGGSTRRITNDLSNYQGATLTSDGKSVLSVQENYLSNVWTANAENPAKPRQLTTELGRDEGMSGIAVAPNGMIAYTVRIRGDQDIWTINPDGSGNRPITQNSKSNFSPVISPDGRFIAFVSTRGGNQDIWKMNIDGGDPVQLTSGPDSDADPAFSPDGKFVYYHSTDGEQLATIWRVPVEGGTPEQVTKFRARKPQVSPDGMSLLCETTQAAGDTEPKLSIVSTSGGNILNVLNFPAAVRSRTIRWTSDGKGIIYVESQNRTDNLWMQPLDGSKPSQITDLSSDRIFRFDMLAGGGTFVMARGNENSDVVVVRDFR